MCKVLDQESAARRPVALYRWRQIVTLAGLLFLVGRLGFAQGQGSPPQFRTAKVTRGDVVATVGATGTLEPEDSIDVGASVAGQIVSLGIDPHGDGKPIDFGSQVEVGTVLARIDDTSYKLRVEQEEAGWRRAKAEFEGASARASREPTESNLAAKRAAEAAVAQSKAAMELAKLNLDCTVIKSPVKGVIIDRRVIVGQNVSPDANASSLFLIAKDLAKMQIWALVNEADIGRVRVGQQVNFTVAAYPREHFHGTVGQIRLNAQPMQNVIAYTVVVAIDNSSHRLLPYLTADVKFEIGRRRNVLRAPNEALRWKPTQEQRSAGGSEGDNLLWLVDKDGKHVRSIAVQTGLNDGTVTEVSGPEIKEGMEVVVDEASPWGSSRGESDNPFRPQIRRPTDGR